MPRSLRNPRIAGFLVAEALSAIGSWASLVAIWGYAAFEFDAGAADISLFGVAFSAPALLLGPFAGAVVDQVGPKATLAAAKILGIVASLLLLAADSFTGLAILSALHGTSSTFSHPAIQAMPPRLVDDVHLARANALVSLTDEVAIVLGPVAAGVAIAAIGFQGAFVFDAFTYAVGLAALPLVSLRPRLVIDDAHAATSGDGSMLDGWRRIRRVPALRRVVSCTALVHLLYGAALLLEPLYVRDVLGRSEEVFAALQTVFGVVLVLAGLVVAKLGERLVAFSTVAFGVVLSGLSAVLYLSTTSIVIAFGGICAWAVATAVMGGPSRTVLQRSSPETEHGRVMAADLVAGGAAELFALASLGLLIDTIGLRTSAALVGSTVAAAGVVLAVADRRDRDAHVLASDAARAVAVR